MICSLTFFVSFTFVFPFVVLTSVLHQRKTFFSWFFMIFKKTHVLSNLYARANLRHFSFSANIVVVPRSAQRC